MFSVNNFETPNHFTCRPALVYITQIKIMMGTNRRSADKDGVIYRGVKAVKIQEKYERFYWGYDIAIIVLDSPVPITDFVKPICLPSEDEHIPITSLCYTTGWGYTNFESEYIFLRKYLFKENVEQL